MHNPATTSAKQCLRDHISLLWRCFSSFVQHAKYSFHTKGFIRLKSPSTLYFQLSSAHSHVKRRVRALTEEVKRMVRTVLQIILLPSQEMYQFNQSNLQLCSALHFHSLTYFYSPHQKMFIFHQNPLWQWNANRVLS